VQTVPAKGKLRTLVRPCFSSKDPTSVQGHRFVDRHARKGPLRIRIQQIEMRYSGGARSAGLNGGRSPLPSPITGSRIRPCPGCLKIMRRCSIQKITLAVCAIDDRRSVLCILASAVGPNGSSPCLFIVHPLWRRQCSAPRAPATCDYPK